MEKIPETPRTKTKRLLRIACSASIHKTLIFHHALIDQMKTIYQETADQRQTHLLTSGLWQDSEEISLAEQSLCFSAKRWKACRKASIWRKPYRSVSAKFAQVVSDFFEHDDVS